MDNAISMPRHLTVLQTILLLMDIQLFKKVKNILAGHAKNRWRAGLGLLAAFCRPLVDTSDLSSRITLFPKSFPLPQHYTLAKPSVLRSGTCPE